MQKTPEIGDRLSHFRRYWQEMGEKIKSSSGPFYYLSNVGNAGDAFIAEATFQFFELNGIAPRFLLPTDEMPTEGTLIVSGGGMLIPSYRYWHEAFDSLVSSPNKTKVFVLPCSVHGIDEYLSRMDDRFHFFCREQDSILFCNGVAGFRGTASFAHDMALGIDLDMIPDFADADLGVDELALLESFRRKTATIEPDKFGVLSVMRHDPEAVIMPEDDSGDLPVHIITHWADRALTGKVVRLVLEKLSSARFIVTNRLHMGVGGFLVGRPVRYFDNSYGKVRGVYEASLRDWDSVEFLSLGGLMSGRNPGEWVSAVELRRSHDYIKDLLGFRTWAEKRIAWSDQEIESLRGRLADLSKNDCSGSYLKTDSNPCSLLHERTESRKLSGGDAERDSCSTGTPLADSSDAPLIMKPCSKKVSVITRTKNRPLLLKRAISSVLSQTYANWQLVIVNDGGEVDSVRSLVEAEKTRLHGRLVLIENPTSLGMEAASNAGIRASDGEYLVIHDDDDSWHPEFLAKCMNALDTPRSPTVRGVIAHCCRIVEDISGDVVNEISRDPFNTWISHVSLYRMSASNMFPPISFVFERETALRIGLFDETLPVLGDWDFHYRFLLECDIEVIPEILANYHHRTSIKSEAGGAYGNTVIAGFDKHRYYENLLRNKWLREDVRRGRIGMGQLHHQSQIFETLMGELGQVKSSIKKKKFLGLF